MAAAQRPVSAANSAAREGVGTGKRIVRRAFLGTVGEGVLRSPCVRIAPTYESGPRFRAILSDQRFDKSYMRLARTQEESAIEMRMRNHFEESERCIEAARSAPRSFDASPGRRISASPRRCHACGTAGRLRGSRG